MFPFCLGGIPTAYLPAWSPSNFCFQFGIPTLRQIMLGTLRYDPNHAPLKKRYVNSCATTLQSLATSKTHTPLSCSRGLVIPHPDTILITSILHVYIASLVKERGIHTRSLTSSLTEPFSGWTEVQSVSVSMIHGPDKCLNPETNKKELENRVWEKS